MFAPPVFAQVLKPWGSCVTPEGVPTLSCLTVIFNNILMIASAFIVLVLFIMLVVGAFNYLTSFGNPEKVKKAQQTIMFAVLGFVVFMLSYLILNVICFLFLGGIGSNCKLFQFNIP